MSGILSIDIDEADLEKKKNKSRNDINEFNNKHIIQCYNKTISNIPEEPRFISSTIPPVFINGRYESRCYANSSFQVLFFIIFLRQLRMNIYCEKITKNMDNIEYDYRCYIQRIIIMQVIQLIFCEMLIGGRKIVNSDIIFEVTNIRTNV